MRRSWLTYSNVMATIAVFVALGGTSYAITKLPKDSVGSAQVQDGSLQLRDLAGSAKRIGSRGPRGGEGPAGPVGPAGAAGQQGPAGPSELINVRRDAAVSIPASGGGSATVATVTLPAGSWLLEAQTLVSYEPPSPGSEWYTCVLKTATGMYLGQGQSRVGTDASAEIEAPIPARGAARFDVATQVVFVCLHPSNVPTPAATASATVLQATRVGQITEQ